VDNKIILITPPDKIFNQNHSVLLIHPSDGVRKQAQEILAKSNGKQNVYLYNPVDTEDEDIDWLLTIAKMSDVVVLDYDNSSDHVKSFASYLISLSHTYWLTSDDWMLYNKLSPNRIYGLDIIEDLIGGQIETK
jgi:hypothetical protein